MTCLIIWGARSALPTESNHEADQTYIPDGLYLATVVSLGLVFAATVLIDRWVAAKSLLATVGFVIGFGVGVVLFILRLPWSTLDRFGGEMFSLFDWWIAPILGVLGYCLGAVLDRARRPSQFKPTPAPAVAGGSAMTAAVLARVEENREKERKAQRDGALRGTGMKVSITRGIPEFVASARELGVEPVKPAGGRRACWSVMLRLPDWENDGAARWMNVPISVYPDQSWEYASHPPTSGPLPSDAEVREAFTRWLQSRFE
ncbi:hypothetical protein [Nocardia farcinica]|uniref:hypothetical protein n=1 Tax=Nocardia farcinica TaxID=37329 RepID=UPI002453F4FE|nr:hypothetical protein [Nocardia farcinica]